jgi:hypothetical protein
MTAWVLIFTICSSFPCSQVVVTGFSSKETCLKAGANNQKTLNARSFDCVEEKKP